MERLTLRITGILAFALAAGACGEGTTDGENGAHGGERGGSAGAGPASSSDSGAPGDSGADSGPGKGTGGSDDGKDTTCPSRTDGSVASHVVITVSWPASLAIEAGTGQIHVWTKADLTYDRTSVTGTVRPCGSTIPALTKTDVVGGGQVQIELPAAVWDAPAMPVFQATGSTTGFDVGSKIKVNPVASLLGLAMQDPMNAPWPDAPSQVTTVDHDGDGQAGIAAVPRTDVPFAAPPLDLGGVLDPRAPRPDHIFLSTRTVLALDGARDTCKSARGTASVTKVDSHVVGCHVLGGGLCTTSQSDFIDLMQPKFTIVSGTFDMVDVPGAATCAEVRAALPAGGNTD